MMRAAISPLEAPFLRTMLEAMSAPATVDEVLAAAEAAEICLDVRGVLESQRAGSRFTFEAPSALITVVRGRGGWMLDSVEAVPA